MPPTGVSATLGGWGVRARDGVAGRGMFVRCRLGVAGRRVFVRCGLSVAGVFVRWMNGVAGGRALTFAFVVREIRNGWGIAGSGMFGLRSSDVATSPGSTGRGRSCRRCDRLGLGVGCIGILAEKRSLGDDLGDELLGFAAGGAVADGDHADLVLVDHVLEDRPWRQSGGSGAGGGR